MSEEREKKRLTTKASKLSTAELLQVVAVRTATEATAKAKAKAKAKAAAGAH